MSRKGIDPDKKNQVIRLLTHTDKSYREISEATGVSITTTYNLSKIHRSKYRRKVGRKSERSSSSMEEWLRHHRFDKKCTLQEMADLMGVTRERVRQILKKHDMDGRIDLSSSYLRRRKEFLDVGNLGYFNTIDTEHKAYWLGYLHGKARIKIYEQRKSIAINTPDNHSKFIEPLMKELEVDPYFRSYEYKGEMREKATATINSHTLAEQLESYHLSNPKHVYARLPESIPEHLIRHFFRGFFDGKGFITPIKGETTFIFSIYGPDIMLFDFCTYFSDKLSLNIPSGAVYKRKESEKNMVFRTSSRALSIPILNHLYDGASIYHDRNYNNYMEQLQQE